MRDIVSCFSQNAVNVVSPYSSCSSYSSNNIINPTTISSPSIQNSVSNVYKLVLSTLKQLLITVTWCKNHSNQGLTISFNDNHHNSPSSTIPFRLNTNSRFFRKKKGSKLLEIEDQSKVEVFWDLSNARYDSGPEPIDGFYVLIMVDSEIGLVLGETGFAEETMSSKKLFKSNKTASKLAKSSLLLRREHCSGNSTLYATKAKFSDTGTWHDVVIKCSAENDGGLKLKHPVLSVCIDEKTVIRVKRLQWNFRGNQTIFVDGLLVDLLWDVHDWFFSSSSNNDGSGSVSGSSSGYAVFMFRTRSGLDSRLWLEEKSGGGGNGGSQKDDKERIEEFSLLIYACKSS